MECWRASKACTRVRVTAASGCPAVMPSLPHVLMSGLPPRATHIGTKEKDDQRGCRRAARSAPSARIHRRPLPIKALQTGVKRMRLAARSLSQLFTPPGQRGGRRTKTFGITQHGGRARTGANMNVAGQERCNKFIKPAQPESSRNEWTAAPTSPPAAISHFPQGVAPEGTRGELLRR